MPMLFSEKLEKAKSTMTLTEKYNAASEALQNQIQNLNDEKTLESNTKAWKLQGVLNGAEILLDNINNTIEDIQNTAKICNKRASNNKKAIIGALIQDTLKKAFNRQIGILKKQANDLPETHAMANAAIELAAEKFEERANFKPSIEDSLF